MLVRNECIDFFSDFALGSFQDTSFPQEKRCSETPLELFLLSELLPSPSTLILPEFVILTFLMCLEESPELGNLWMVSDAPSLLTKCLGHL